MILQALLTPPNVPANSSVVQTYPITGLNLLDFIDFNQQSHIAGLSIGNAWVSAQNVLSVQFINSTVAAINGSPATQYLVQVNRVENGYMGLVPAAFPTAIV
jgi:hypothetical protein